MNHKQSQQLCQMLGVSFPIIQAGMVWVSGAKLAAASSNAGILGVIGAGSMTLDLLRDQIKKAHTLTDKPFAVNIPLLYSKVEQQVEVALSEGVKIFITSAGSPKKLTGELKKAGAKVLHVVSNPLFALKSEEAGVDAVVAEGFEAGGHNGLDEITTFCLIPQVKKVVKVPVIAAGGVCTGEQMAAAFCLGAAGVQIGTRFVTTEESSAHPKFKQAILESQYNSTELSLKGVMPVRLLKNKFYQEIKSLEESCATKEVLLACLGKGRARKGMLLGDLDEGELEIGQGCALIDNLPKVCECVDRLLSEYNSCIRKIHNSFIVPGGENE